MKRATLTICPECERANTYGEEICRHCGTSLVDETGGPLLNNGSLSDSETLSDGPNLPDDYELFPPAIKDGDFIPSAGSTSDLPKPTNAQNKLSILIDLIGYRLRLALTEIFYPWKLTREEQIRLFTQISEFVQTNNRNSSSARWRSIFSISLIRVLVQFLRLFFFVIVSLLLSVLLLVTFFMGTPVVHRTIRLNSPIWYRRCMLILGGIVVFYLIEQVLS